MSARPPGRTSLPVPNREAPLADQNYANHKRTVFGFHVVAFGLMFVGLVWAVWKLIRGPSVDAAMNVAVIFSLGMALFYARTFALAAQNRVIRLEEQLRLDRVLPEELRARIGELGMSHFIALRFAADAELPGLVSRVLSGELADQDAIKQAIRQWRPDHTRV